MTQRSAVLLCALLAACSGSVPEAGRPSPTVAATGVVVAVDRGAQGVGLYRVGADRKATPFALLAPPTGAEVRSVTLGGPGPDVCVVWGKRGDDGSGTASELRCYVDGDTEGVPVPVTGEPDLGAELSADGKQLVWTAHPTPDGPDYTPDDQDLVTASFDQGRVGDVRRYAVYVTGGGPSTDVGCLQVVGVAWAGQQLLLECSGDNDYPGGLLLQGPEPGSHPTKVPDEEVVPPYNYLTRVGAAATSTALAIQGEYCEIECLDHLPPASRRAVRVDLATGRVLEVIATALPGRSVTSVSGGPRGVVYVTAGRGGTRAYLRLPGEKHGVLVTGLPADVEGIVAQP